MRHLLCPMVVAVALGLASAFASAREDRTNMLDARTQEAIALMTSFAERTGLTSARPPRRYLWTDAFAVCNYLGLARATHDEEFAALARRLVDQVHHTLGQHRDDDQRSGWISGLSGGEGEAHPTRGGLRIGKADPERAPDEPFDEQLEWERDGQYFHYLSKWMHALDQMSRATGEPQFNRWARELAETAFNAFTYVTSFGAPRRMYWKMSIDLTRALVSSMGQHDPLDGYVTTLQLQSTAAGSSASIAGPELAAESAQFATMIPGVDWATPDALGIGGLLVDAYRLHQLMQEGALSDDRLLTSILTASLDSLQFYARSKELQASVDYRLAFRELGLAIGLHAVQRLWDATQHQPEPTSMSTRVSERVQALMQYTALAKEIESFWRNPEHQRAVTWLEHRDINEVMLATALAPEGFLVLGPPQ